MKKYVYMFNEGNKDMRDLLGGKGANLAYMTNSGFPVPYGFTITSEACNDYFKSGNKISEVVKKEILSSLEKLESKTGKKLGSVEKPLLVSVRSGARISMPGMLDTILNLGMNDEVCASIAKLTRNPKFAYDSYRRLIYMFANVVKNKDISKFEKYLSDYKKKKGVTYDRELDAIDFKEISNKYKELYKELVGEEFPQDVKIQLLSAVNAVFESWENDRAVTYRKLNDIPFEYGTSVNIQSMVYGNMGSNSGTGVAFTRNPSTGENKLFGEFLIDAQGEDVVSGIRTPEAIDKLKKIMPKVYEEFEYLSKKLEKEYKDMQDLEFTVENGKLYLLQTRIGKRTGYAAIKIATDLVKEGLITKEEAILKVDAKNLDSVLHPTFSEEALKENEVLTTGLAASPGASYGKVCFSREEAVKRSEAGEKELILVRDETSPEDIDGMKVASGILTLRGGMTSHAAVVARGMAKCCISAVENTTINEKEKTITINNKTFGVNDYISLDGFTGNVYAGKLKREEFKVNKEYEEFMGWVDEVRNLKVRANADTAKDATVAKKFGAEGIGLCRTEHMFFSEDRIHSFRKMILSTTLEEREKALNEILPYQTKDFTELFKIISHDPVVIRLLDPPLHEFLPKEKKEIISLASELGTTHNKLIKRIDALKEVNPMMGHRGCRLLITYPEIAKMQTKAIIEAQKKLLKEDKKVTAEIMIPLVSEIKEFEYLKNIIEDMYKEELDKGIKLDYQIGTMIETPRACITSRRIAKVADFYSFGTNDLTQLTYGFSRDDSTKYIDLYTENSILEANPFSKLDINGVGKLLEIGVKEGKKGKKTLNVGVCGEQGGDPSSIMFFEKCGVDYVSCSAYRVPIAKLATAQAAIKSGDRK